MLAALLCLRRVWLILGLCWLFTKGWALHVFLGYEPLTEGIKRHLMRVEGMTEMT